MQIVNWGIIGCGDVTEVKSGPAFNKVPNSRLVAVMRRDAVKAEDYARRHNVPTWYNDAQSLIDDPAVNAIYVATPPSSHEAYTIAALKAGKPVYVEKPMSLNAASALRMTTTARETGQKLVVAHYRREQPLFKKIHSLIREEAVGPLRFVRLELYKKCLTAEDLANPQKAWRVNFGESGGGIFHDLAPHQLDLMYHFFGPSLHATGMSGSQTDVYDADDIVAGMIRFKSGVIFDGLWSFASSPFDEKDQCTIAGEKGTITFSFFEHSPIILRVDGITQKIAFDPLQHVQQPMIEKVVKYFRGECENPCSGEDGVSVMKLMDAFVSG